MNVTTILRKRIMQIKKTKRVSVSPEKVSSEKKNSVSNY
jgi:hypothetical protein